MGPENVSADSEIDFDGLLFNDYPIFPNRLPSSLGWNSRFQISPTTESGN